MQDNPGRVDDRSQHGGRTRGNASGHASGDGLRGDFAVHGLTGLNTLAQLIEFGPDGGHDGVPAVSRLKGRNGRRLQDRGHGRQAAQGVGGHAGIVPPGAD